jgi:hypothetical protein
VFVIEESDTTDSDGGRIARVMLDILDEEEALVPFLLGDQVR